MAPRMLTETPPPGWAERVCRFRPGARPCRSWLTVVVPTGSSRSTSTVVTAPLRLRSRCATYPTTTMFSSTCTSGTSATSITSRPSTGTSCVTYPTKEKTRVSRPAGTCRRYVPSTPVAVPRSVPRITMFTPGSGVPSSRSVTCPRTVCWAPTGAAALPARRSRNSKNWVALMETRWFGCKDQGPGRRGRHPIALPGDRARLPRLRRTGRGYLLEPRILVQKVTEPHEPIQVQIIVPSPSMTVKMKR
ncbi:MAG: hypothetical protein KatS3mg043_1470 [Rhodothermaceae bacterium]|nr:MAG: hypothetical protein KatS3mg043_1470 [Rhodothermaceae bacterium]